MVENPNGTQRILLKINRNLELLLYAIHKDTIDKISPMNRKELIAEVKKYPKNTFGNYMTTKTEELKTQLIDYIIMNGERS